MPFPLTGLQKTGRLKGDGKAWSTGSQDQERKGSSALSPAFFELRKTENTEGLFPLLTPAACPPRLSIALQSACLQQPGKRSRYLSLTRQLNLSGSSLNEGWWPRAVEVTLPLMSTPTTTNAAHHKQSSATPYPAGRHICQQGAHTFEILRVTLLSWNSCNQLAIGAPDLLVRTAS